MPKDDEQRRQVFRSQHVADQLVRMPGSARLAIVTPVCTDLRERRRVELAVRQS